MSEESAIVAHLKKEHERLMREVRGVSAALAAFGAAYQNGSRTENGAKGRKPTAQSRSRMAAAQKARWAKVKNGAGTQEVVAITPKKKTMSAAARKKISSSQKARWAKVKKQSV